MITEDYVSFEIAKLLKEKGFDEKCRYVYSNVGGKISSENFMEGESFVDNSDIELVAKYNEWITSTQGDYAFLCPTLQMAMKWLREEYNLHFLLSPYNRDSNPLVVYYNIDIVKPPEFVESFYSNIGKDQSYEEACEDAIKYCLENLI